MNFCFQCGKYDVSLIKCSGCKVTYYCSEDSFITLFPTVVEPSVTFNFLFLEIRNYNTFNKSMSKETCLLAKTVIKVHADTSRKLIFLAGAENKINPTKHINTLKLPKLL